MENRASKSGFVSGATSFTVRQLSELFGKSEDTIRRWKNEGIGRGDDNIRLEAIENEDAFGRRTSRHLAFTRRAVRDFVRVNPFLMDDAPLLQEFMEQEDKAAGVIALPANIETVRGTIARAQEREDEDGTVHAEQPRGGFMRRFLEAMNQEDEEAFGEEESEREEEAPAFDPEEEEDVFSRFHSRGRRRPPFEEEDEDDEAEDERQKLYDEATLRYMLRLLRIRETSCRRELNSVHQASTIFYRRKDIAEALFDGGDYVSELVNEREKQLDEEMEKIRKTMRELEHLLW